LAKRESKSYIVHIYMTAHWSISLPQVCTQWGSYIRTCHINWFQGDDKSNMTWSYHATKSPMNWESLMWQTLARRKVHTCGRYILFLLFFLSPLGRQGNYTWYLQKFLTVHKIKLNNKGTLKLGMQSNVRMKTLHESYS
jgi:hypothetical protein